ncbi:MAG: DUF1016 family protein [Labilithrix sp.]|nr:DUF1016 family protein [Labilithrix sp.]
MGEDEFARVRRALHRFRPRLRRGGLAHQPRPRIRLGVLRRRRREDALYRRVVEIIEGARRHVARTVDTAMVQAYWLVGYAIVEVEQQGRRRAGYGEGLLDRLSARLTRKLGTGGLGARTLSRIRRFYLTYPEGSALPPELRGSEIRTQAVSKSKATTKALAIRTQAVSNSRSPAFAANLSWSHYLTLLKVDNPTARAFYEIEATREGWSYPELQRQIDSLLFERLARSRDKERVRALAREGHIVEKPSDLLKRPFVVEFLGLEERAHWQERDLEQAIIDRIEAFLLELGKGFCFVARQKRLTVDGDHFYVDLVFYNRLLRCFVLVDLKIGKLTHEDLGQMQMYVHYFDRYQRVGHEAKTIGIILCSAKNDAMAKITLPEDNKQILAARYQLYLPTEEELRAELERDREDAERALSLAALMETRHGER